MWDWIQKAIPFVGSIFGDVTSAISQERTNEANKEMAENQMAFQERMSNTAHQREIKDLKEAGLNPILSAKYGGSSTPPGATATMINPIQSGGASINSAMQTAMDMRLKKENINTLKTQQLANSAQAANNFASAGKNEVETAVSAQNLRTRKNEADISDAESFSRKSWFGKWLTPIADTFGAIGNIFRGSASTTYKH